MSSLRATASLAVLLCWLLTACATTPATCGAGGPPCPPPGALDDAFINDLYEQRAWVPERELRPAGIDPVRIGTDAVIPVNAALAKFLGAPYDAARDSLALKLWLIGQARHTIDYGYYIHEDDVVGRAMLGALCRAVQRGVDVRVVVDAIGSLGTPRESLAALEICEENAGWMRNAQGQATNRRARVQVVLFNAPTRFAGSPNRRSHDKLLVIDGAFGEQAFVLTGGRNISLDYYGIDAEGREDPHSYRDAELLLRGLPGEPEQDIGRVSTGYFTLLFLYRGNRLLKPALTDAARTSHYRRHAQALDALETIEGMAVLRPHFAAMPAFVEQGFTEVRALLAHELANLENVRVVREAVKNARKNPNSILYLLDQIARDASPGTTSRIVSPYPFFARYVDRDKNVLIDEAEAIRRWLDEHPDAQIELITNSVVSADNFPAQSVVDMEAVPRLLLDPPQREAWLALDPGEEVGGALTDGGEWLRQVSHPRLRVYEMGRLDSDLLTPGGTTYGKLHAKYWVAGDVGFVGTTNFDYRSRLFNNEMGFFFRGAELAADIEADFEFLKSRSTLWGSPEWLEMRSRIMALDDIKGWSTRKQRSVYKTLEATGLQWLF
jgi:phosphatidylserine/phosphatidylglycerophosphate/cardiolipin synthase-like enzyme